MGYKSYKVVVPPKSMSGAASERAYCDLVLGMIKDTFLASGKWELESDIETIGTNTGTDNGTRTLQLHSTVTNGPHLRIWYFTGSYTRYYFVDEDTASGNYNNLKVYKGNVFKCNNVSGNPNYGLVPSSNPGFVFGVSDSSIGADFGYALDLKVPLFSVRNDYEPLSSSVSPYDAFVSSYGATISIITDGLMFGMIEYYNAGGSTGYKWQGFVYAPDMMVCANDGDDYTAGVIGVKSTNNFYFGDSDTNTGDYMVALFANKAGTFDFAGLKQGINCGRSQLLGSQSSSKMLTAPLTVFMYPGTYAGSTATGVTDGIGLKGWANTKYVRGAHKDVLPYSMKSSTFAGGEWICMNTATLLCWDSTNSNPFDDSVAE